MTSPDNFVPTHDPGWGDMAEMAHQYGTEVANTKDGQLELNERVELLSPLQDYGSAYANALGGLLNKGQVGFTNQVGPMTGCHLAAGRIVLDDLGQWDITCKLWFDYIVRPISGMVEWEIRVLTPSGAPFSRSKNRLETNDPVTSSDPTSVVVPAPGYQVQVFITEMAPGRGALGGPEFNRLTVQHISRDIHTGDTGAS